MNTLCKLNGMLVLFEVSKTKEPDGRGRCPACGSKSFEEYNGWLECRGDNCDFAVLKKHNILTLAMVDQEAIEMITKEF